MEKSHLWLFYAIITTVFRGGWRTYRNSGYVMWSLTKIPFAAITLYFIRLKIETDMRSILLGSAVGILGAGGQLLLFQALRDHFSFLPLTPSLILLLSVILLKEKISFFKMDRDCNSHGGYYLPILSRTRSIGRTGYI